MNRNKGYVYKDHMDFITSLRRESFLKEPVRIDGGGDSEDVQTVLRRYEQSRAHLDSYNRRRSFQIVRRVREKLGI